MSTKRDPERRGLGKVVYSVDPEAVQEQRLDRRKAPDDIEEASEESFPASDPPGYTRGAADPAASKPIKSGRRKHPPHTEATQAMTERDRDR